MNIAYPNVETLDKRKIFVALALDPGVRRAHCEQSITNSTSDLAGQYSNPLFFPYFPLSCLPLLCSNELM